MGLTVVTKVKECNCDSCAPSTDKVNAKCSGVTSTGTDGPNNVTTFGYLMLE